MEELFNGQLSFADIEAEKFLQIRRTHAEEALQNPHLWTMGEADLFKRVTFDQVLKSVESSRER